ncbi:LysM peptidoglycan-binding domain-containing protein [Deinococcus psychrotolerans]|uniref:LysM peptidoglycan-binding domain-containing protein n=1 Tax=Deinococcus psychrotolerans TaxID=2489213 RepID=A0A3G8YM29_9DEIO|nr:LysM peptidoglycan-binding domain-containing protein [Deinococcus psychrotolerans]AZI43644.1 LysM peptidoglycan-binding domain-containing protein [Deinococcus psychrotolerans]
MKLTLLSTTLLAVCLAGDFASALSSSAASYTVQPGDTLYQLSRRAGVDAATLLKLNGLSSSTLKVGQQLRLPAGGAAQKKAQPLQGAIKPSAIPARPALPPGLPKVQVSGPVGGPLIWKNEPAATVASFVGWSPVINVASFGDALPLRTYLRGLAFDFQTYNNCGPSALSAVLGFYKVRLSQAVVQQTTRQGGEYMQVSAIAPELAKFGLRTRTIRGGSLRQVKKLLALGIPVIVLQWYDRPGHINHFRVVRGYDDQAGVMWVSDSMVGPVSYLSYRDFDALWNTQGRQMFPVYPAGYEAQVKTFL